jgi:hypothetical protein
MRGTVAQLDGFPPPPISSHMWKLNGGPRTINEQGQAIVAKAKCQNGWVEAISDSKGNRRVARCPRWLACGPPQPGQQLYHLGVPAIVIQRILRHSNVSTTANYYIRTAADDVRNAMAMLEKTATENTSALPDTFGTLKPILSAQPESIN